MSTETTPVKRRKLQGACDICKKKKIRCDSPEMPGNKCTNCITFRTHCTHLYISKGSSSSLNYKNSREHVAAILSQTTAYVPSNDPTVLCQILVEIARYARNLEELLALSASPSTDLFSSSESRLSFPPQDNIATTVDNKQEDSNDGVFVDIGITDPLRRLALPFPISEADENYRYYGKSSNMNFMKAAMAYIDNPGGAYTFDAQRPEFWIIQPWQQPLPESPPPQFFPNDELLQNFIDIYFRHINSLIFLLHSPSFRASVADGEHLRDHYFGAVVLVVCALAARFSNHPKVLIDGDSPEQSAGWKWFRQARSLQLATSSKNIPSRSLHKLQLICLSVFFLAGTSTPRECWILTGVGIRVAQEMGAHRRIRYTTGSRREAELLKRVFWMLIATDTIMSSLFGRPTATASEDYDIDMPVECDDEYWDEPHCFQQPPNKPPLSAYATSYLKLIGIFNRAQRAIHPVKRQTEYEVEIVAELDSALNKWIDSIPSHRMGTVFPKFQYSFNPVRWDPNREGIFLDQSTSLYVTYYHIQMLIHRPFIPSPGMTTAVTLDFPSLAICANSARSLGHVMEVQARRGSELLHQPQAINALFDSAVILLLNVWGGRRAKLSPSDITRAVADIKKCVDVLHLYERRWPIAGSKCDIITEMLNRTSGNSSHTPPSMKWARHPGDEDSRATFPAATAAQQLEQLELSIQQTDHLFSLPFYTQELGALPIYESFDFQYDFQHQTQLSESAPTGSAVLGYSPLDGCAEDGFITAYAVQEFSRTDSGPQVWNTVNEDEADQSHVAPPVGSNWQDWSRDVGPADGQFL